jgi:Zn-dependent oligopeptidase
MFNTLISNCQTEGINAREYLTDIFEQLAQTTTTTTTVKELIPVAGKRERVKEWQSSGASRSGRSLESIKVQVRPEALSVTDTAKDHALRVKLFEQQLTKGKRSQHRRDTQIA